MDHKFAPTRREALGSAAAAVALAGLAPLTPAADAGGRFPQSIAFWCFNSAGEKWDIDTTCRVAKELGCKSVELAAPEEWGVVKKYGLVCAIAPNGMPGAPFVKGFNNPRYHDEVIARTKKTIDACAEAKFPADIAFTGYKWVNADDPHSGEISRDGGAANCSKAMKRLVGPATK